MVAPYAPSPVGVPHQADRIAEPRSFTGLHRDAWALLRSNPVVLLAIPALLWFPFDVVSEWMSTGAGEELLEQFRAAQRIGNLGSLIVGTLTTAMIMVAMREAAQGRTIGVAEAFREGAKLWGTMIGVLFIGGLYTVLGLLCFVVPGFIVAARIALAPAVVVFEGRSASDAIRRSNEIVKARGTGTIMLWGFLAYIIYAVLSLLVIFVFAFAGEIFFAGSESSLLYGVFSAAVGAPINLVASGVLVGSAIVYVDAVGKAALYPVGRELSIEGERRVPHPAGTGALGVAISAGLAGVGAVVVAAVMLVFVLATMGEDGELLPEPDAPVEQVEPLE
jgi:hypothetical protein